MKCKKAEAPKKEPRDFSFDQIKEREGVYQVEGYMSYFISFGSGVILRYEAAANELSADSLEWKGDRFSPVEATVCFEILAPV